MYILPANLPLLYIIQRVSGSSDVHAPCWRFIVLGRVNICNVNFEIRGCPSLLSAYVGQTVIKKTNKIRK